MIDRNKGMHLVLLLCAAMAAGAVQAGDSQVGFRIGKNWLKVDAENMATGTPVDEGLGSFAFTFAYRWDSGGYLQLGHSEATNLDIFSFSTLEHYWLGGGWQFDLDEHWKLTPVAGLTYSNLEADDEELFDGEPTTHIQDTVPFAEILVERHLGRHFALGLYARENFERWGSSRGWGVSVAWRWGATR
jgi:hypothetical protein